MLFIAIIQKKEIEAIFCDFNDKSETTKKTYRFPTSKAQ